MARILIIEDEEFFREEIKKLVTELGYEAIVVEPQEDETYVQAVSKVVNEITSGKEKFDAVLMDGDLRDKTFTPPLTGHVFAEMLKEQKERGLRLISITSMALTSYQEDLYNVQVKKNTWNWDNFKAELGRELGKLVPSEEKPPLA